MTLERDVDIHLRTCILYILDGFVDIEGAFNNVTIKAINEALTRIGLEGCLTHRVVTMLRNRITKFDLEDLVNVNQFRFDYRRGVSSYK